MKGKKNNKDKKSSIKKDQRQNQNVSEKNKDTIGKNIYLYVMNHLSK